MATSKLCLHASAHSISVQSMKPHQHLIIYHSLIVTFLNRHLDIILKMCLLMSDTEILTSSLRSWKFLFFCYFPHQYFFLFTRALYFPHESKNRSKSLLCYKSCLSSKQQVHHIGNTLWINFQDLRIQGPFQNIIEQESNTWIHCAKTWNTPSMGIKESVLGLHWFLLNRGGGWFPLKSQYSHRALTSFNNLVWPSGEKTPLF